MGQFEIHGTTVIVVSLEEDKRSVEHFAYVVEQILETIKLNDPLCFLRVQRYVRYICLSDSFRKTHSYDVYSKALYLNVPFLGYEADPGWILGEYAGYLVERAVFGKIFWSTEVFFDSSKYDRISNILYQKRKNFSHKLGPSWVLKFKRMKENDEVVPLWE